MFDWTAGGKTLLLARSGPVEQGAGIVELDPVTGSEKLIYRPKDGVEKVKFFAMKCSPDYKRLAYTLNRKLMVFNLETGESQEMASGVWCPNWSKNGEMLICLGPSKSKDGHNHWLSVIPTNGGEMSTYNISENLPQGCKIRSFDWTPDGKKLAFHINKSSHEVVLYQNLIPEDQ